MSRPCIGPAVPNPKVLSNVFSVAGSVYLVREVTLHQRFSCCQWLPSCGASGCCLVGRSWEGSAATADGQPSTAVHRQRSSPVTALAWTAATPDPWLAAAHAGGEVDVFVLRSGCHGMQAPAATITMRNPSTALALAWNPWAPHVLMTGSSDQTVRGWDVTHRKHANPEAQAPLVPFAEAASAELIEEDSSQQMDTSRDSAPATVLAEQMSAPQAAAADASAASAPASAAAAATASATAGAAGGSAAVSPALSAPGVPALVDVRAAQAALDVSTAAELQRPPHEAQGAASAAPATPHLSERAADSPDCTTLQAAARGSASAAADEPVSMAVVVPLKQQRTEHEGDLDAAAASGPAQSTAEQLPELPQRQDDLVSRPVDPAEVAAIRGGVAQASKSPLRAAASLGVGSTVSHLQNDEQGQHVAGSAHQAASGDGAARPAPADASRGAPELTTGDDAAPTGLAGQSGAAGAVRDPSVPTSGAAPAHGEAYTAAVAWHC